MNVYDFDNTILRGDSTARFFAFCFRHYPSVWPDIPAQAFNGLLFALRLRSKLAFKQRMLGFVRRVPDIDRAVEDFWRENMSRVKPFYKQKHRPNDVVISASPEFLIAPACKALGIRFVIGSVVDKRTGRFSSPNCHDTEKVNRFRGMFPAARVEEFYSDSRSDDPMARLAGQAYLVKGDAITKW